MNFNKKKKLYIWNILINTYKSRCIVTIRLFIEKFKKNNNKLLKLIFNMYWNLIGYFKIYTRTYKSTIGAYFFFKVQVFCKNDLTHIIYKSFLTLQLGCSKGD